MLKEIRQERILEYLRTNQFASIQELSILNQTSHTTVRRDLISLKATGQIIADRSGVRIVSDSVSEGNLNYRSAINPAIKAMIAHRAAQLIPNDSLIFLDSSSTILHMLPDIREKNNITVVTHSVAVCTQLINSKIPVYMLGGEYYPPSHAFYGEPAIEMVHHFNFDYCFLSCVTVTPDGFATATWEHSATLRRHVLSRTTHPVLVCDESKIGFIRPHNIAHINEMRYIVTNSTTAFQNIRPEVIRI